MAYFYNGTQQMGESFVQQILAKYTHPHQNKHPYVHDGYKMQPKVKNQGSYQPMDYHPGRPN